MQHPFKPSVLRMFAVFSGVRLGFVTRDLLPPVSSRICLRSVLPLTRDLPMPRGERMSLGLPDLFGVNIYTGATGTQTPAKPAHLQINVSRTFAFVK